MKLLLLTLLSGFSVPSTTHNEFNGGDALHLHKEPHHINDVGE